MEYLMKKLMWLVTYNINTMFHDHVGSSQEQHLHWLISKEGKLIYINMTMQFKSIRCYISWFIDSGHLASHAGRYLHWVDLRMLL